ncbi:MAG: glycosyl hydrolase 115 family protein [Lachnospiraceae bacterium]|nr:glycosyl hydrolase 115 family protein [Lachnospiraceae bacterium]
MKSMRLIITAAVALFGYAMGVAQLSLADKKGGAGAFNVASPKSMVDICCDTADYKVVATVADLLADDIMRVAGKRPQISAAPGNGARQCIIAGTLGHSKWIDDLVDRKKIDASSISDGYERFLIQIVNKPFKGVDRALVVVGNDRRGTAYGLLEISKAIGVSPWYWWLDAPVAHRDEINLRVEKFASPSPSVRYRGVFINDEDWGLLRWAKYNFEKEYGNIGPKTYEKVCELLLRLKANYLCPAMHEASTAFHVIPENRDVADRFGIIMGSSHCEPLLLNTASEWHADKYGEWDYINNRAGVDNVLNARAKELAPYENVYTLALRGLHDRGMNASNDMHERMLMLHDALMAQRRMIAEHTGLPADQIPQAFTPYKEVLDVYDQGLVLPDDVTIIWPDDNYGYMKRLSGPKEQLRSGRSGVYYHASYLGKPHDHLWMNTASPTVMYEELRKAYDCTADRIWLLNAGDIKSCEFAVDFFLAMAYDIDSFDFNRSANYRAEWLCSMLGDEYSDKYADVCDGFYRLAFSRRPEFMGWGYQWATDKHGRERNTDTDFSIANYREVNRRIDEYKRIGAIVDEIMVRIPEEQKPCFYQVLYYPVKGCELLNRMILDGQRNRWYAEQGRASAMDYAESAKLCHDSLDVITKGYNSLLGGKWDHIMTMKQGFAAAYFELPKFRQPKLQDAPSLGVMAEEEDGLKGRGGFHILPAFNRYLDRSYCIDVFSRGSQPLTWRAKSSDDWIRLSKAAGSGLEDRIEVSIDWSKAPAIENAEGWVEISDGEGLPQKVHVSAFSPADSILAQMDSIYVENNGYVSIDAAGFHRKLENDEIAMTVAPYMGFENFAVQIGNPIAPPQRTAGRETPRLEYDFYAFDQGSVDVYTYVLPTFTLAKDRGYAGHEATNSETKYGVCIDEGPVMNPSTSSVEYAQIWYESALKNCRINKTTLHVDKPGCHTLKVICGDAGTVLQKIVLDFGGLKRSYLGPMPTLAGPLGQNR